MAWRKLRDDFRILRADRIGTMDEDGRFRPKPGRSLRDLYRHADPPLSAADPGRDDPGDLAAIVDRLQEFGQAGAKVLLAPGLPDLDAIRTLCRNVDQPVNILMGLAGPRYSVAEPAEAGARRISLGGSFARAARGALIRAAEELRDQGTFSYADDAAPGQFLHDLKSKNRLGSRSG